MKLLESIMTVENVNLEEATRIRDEASEKLQDLWQKTINEEECCFIEMADILEQYEHSEELFGEV